MRVLCGCHLIITASPEWPDWGHLTVGNCSYCTFLCSLCEAERLHDHGEVWDWISAQREKKEKGFNVFSLVRFQFHLFGSSRYSFWDFAAVGEQRQMCRKSAFTKLTFIENSSYWMCFCT